jgi:hypothetical protein
MEKSNPAPIALVHFQKRREAVRNSIIPCCGVVSTVTLSVCCTPRSSLNKIRLAHILSSLSFKEPFLTLSTTDILPQELEASKRWSMLREQLKFCIAHCFAVQLQSGRHEHASNAGTCGSLHWQLRLARHYRWFTYLISLRREGVDFYEHFPYPGPR